MFHHISVISLHFFDVQPGWVPEAQPMAAGQRGLGGGEWRQRCLGEAPGQPRASSERPRMVPPNRSTHRCEEMELHGFMAHAPTLLVWPWNILESLDLDMSGDFLLQEAPGTQVCRCCIHSCSCSQRVDFQSHLKQVMWQTGATPTQRQMQRPWIGHRCKTQLSGMITDAPRGLNPRLISR